MGIFSWFKNTETREESPEVSWDILATGSVGGGVSPAWAENLSTVLSCVQVISSAIASLPCWVYRTTDKGRDTVPDHPLTRLIEHGANDEQTWPDALEFLIAQALLNGNGVAPVKYDRNGQLTEIRPVPWSNVAWQQLKSGRLRYDITMPDGSMKKYLDHEVLHLRDRSDDGLVGKSRLARAAAAFRTGLELQTFSESLYRHGTAPSGALYHDQKLSKEAVDKLRTRFEAAHQGSAKAGKVLILDQGLKWQSISITPEDAELLASRKFSTEEIARIFNVPPPLAGIWDHSSFTNSETAGRWFAQYTIGPWIKKLESEFKRKVFTEPEQDLSIEIDMSGFMRGDYQSRWSAHKIAVDSGILTRDEIREIEGWAPLGGGDVQ